MMPGKLTLPQLPGYERFHCKEESKLASRLPSRF